jgi:hypothetical protein
MLRLSPYVTAKPAMPSGKRKPGKKRKRKGPSERYYRGSSTKLNKKLGGLSVRHQMGIAYPDQ